MALPYSTLQAITHDLIKDRLTEGVFNASVLLRELRAKQEIEDGGKKLILPLMVKDDTESPGGHYSKAEALSLSENDSISASEHDWVYAYQPVVVYKSDIAKNSGQLGVLKLLDSKVKQAKLAMAQDLDKAFLTGTSANKQTVGIDSMIASSGSYGGINSTDLSSWAANVDDNSGVNRALTKAILDGNYDLCVEPGQGSPSHGFCRAQVFTKIKGLITAQQRVMEKDSLDGYGHTGPELIYNGVKYCVDNNVAASTLFHLDLEHFKLYVLKGGNMRVDRKDSLETADALLERVHFYYVTAASERKFHGRINDITE